MKKAEQFSTINPLDESLGAAAGLDPAAVSEISERLRVLLADVFALYIKTKNFPLAYVWSALPRLSFAA